MQEECITLHNTFNVRMDQRCTKARTPYQTKLKYWTSPHMGMQDSQRARTSDRTNKQIEKLTFGQTFIAKISLNNSDYNLNFL